MPRYTTDGIIGQGEGKAAKQRWHDKTIKKQEQAFFLTDLNEDPNLVLEYRLSSCVFRTCCEFNFNCYTCSDFEEIERPMVI